MLSSVLLPLSQLTYEEAVHKLMKVQIEEGNEVRSMSRLLSGDAFAVADLYSLSSFDAFRLSCAT